MRRHRSTLALLLCLTAVAALAPAALPAGQDVDPFYLRALSNGETLFQASSYAQAVSSLEVAAFGLFSRPAELGRVRLLLGLCHAYLNDRAKSEAQLKAAAALLGSSGLAEADLPDQARADLLKLLKQLKLDGSATPPAASPTPKKSPAAGVPAAVKPAPSPDRPQAEPAERASDRSELEKAILDDPRGTDAYYQLASLHERDGDLRAAVRVYQGLLETSPAEIRACFEVGRIRYLERSLRDAEKWLERFLDLAGGVPIEAAFLATGRAYLILSAHLRGDAAKVKTLLSRTPLFDEALVASLDLKPEDKTRLRLILQR